VAGRERYTRKSKTGYGLKTDCRLETYRHHQKDTTMTLQEEIAEVEYHIWLRHNHPLAFAALMHLNEEIDRIRARLSPEAFASLQAESRRAVARRTKGKNHAV
jgi:hypothetical protein